MGLTINTNIPSLLSRDNTATAAEQIKGNMKRLSSGLKVNSAKDDAAGLARADQIKSAIMAMQAAIRNVNDGVSALEIADSGAGQISDIVSRMSELAVSSANGTLDDSSRAAIDLEFNALRDEISRITETTEFGGEALLNGSVPSLGLQIDTSSSGDSHLDIPMADLSLTTLAPGLSGGVGTQAAALSAIGDLNTAASAINDARALYGASSNRLAVAAENLAAKSTNMASAESRIRDLDMAMGVAELTKNQILERSGIATQVQANLNPQNALKLLGL